MSSATEVTPKWFLFVAWLALVWNVLGVAAFFSQMNMDPSALPRPQQLFYEGIPLWATVAFCIAVFGGAIGSLGLVLKRSWALPLLGLSLVGIVVQMSYSFLIGNGLEVFETSALVLPLLTLAIGIALVFLAVLARNRAWI